MKHYSNEHPTILRILWVCVSSTGLFLINSVLVGVFINLFSEDIKVALQRLLGTKYSLYLICIFFGITLVVFFLAWRGPQKEYSTLVQSVAESQGMKSKKNTLRIDLLKRISSTQTNLMTLLLLQIILTIGVVFALNYSLRAAEPERMSGEFNIAVATFTERGDVEGEQVGYEVADMIYQRLEYNFGNRIGFSLWSPQLTGNIEGVDREDRARNAEMRAKYIKADILVYGIVDSVNSKEWRVVPEFFVTSSQFYRISEVAGQYELGSEVVFQRQAYFINRSIVTQKLAERIQLFTAIIDGLRYYAVREFDEALAILESAERQWMVNDGKEVLYLLMGNAAGQDGRFDVAESFLQKSLSYDIEYARAYVSLGSVYRLKAFHGIADTSDYDFRSTDMEFLNKAIQSFERARTARNQPAFSNIPTKVHLGLADCYLLRTLAGQDKNFHTTIAELEIVIQQYSSTPDEHKYLLAEFAAEAYARLGLIYALSGSKSLAIEKYEQALNIVYQSDRLIYDPKRVRMWEDRVNQLRTKETR